jgi:Helix-turn-helix domain
MDSTLLNEFKAAEALGLSVHTLRQWRSERKGPDFVKMGAAVRYDGEALARFKEINTRRIPEAAA